MQSTEKSRIGYAEGRNPHCGKPQCGIHRAGETLGRNGEIHDSADLHAAGETVGSRFAELFLRHAAASGTAVVSQTNAHHICTAGYGGAECCCATYTGHQFH